MKKVFKKMIICIIISLIIQISGLLYLNNNILTSNTTVKSQAVANSTTKTTVSKSNLPSKAATINVSYDASYISYYLNDELYI